MEMLLVGSGCAIAYWMNKDKKKQRVGQDVLVSPNKMPNSPLIYGDERTLQVDEFVRGLAAGKHAEKVKQMFPLDYDRPQGVIANDPFSNATSDVGAPVNLPGGAASAFESNLLSTMSRNPSAAAYDPERSLPMANEITGDVQSSPMFRDLHFKQTPTTANETISLLTGLPMDASHGNMQPFFGSSVKQPSVGDGNSQVQLELFTGMPSSDNMGTYAQKREVLNAPPSNPESPFRSNVYQVKELYDRSLSTLKPSYDHMTPVQSFRDAPMRGESVRILPASIDQTRGPLNKQVTYSGVMVSGQKGSTRAMLPSIGKNRWSLLKENEVSDLLPSKGAVTANPRHILPRVRDVLATEVAENQYVAPALYQRRSQDLSGKRMATERTLEDRASRRIETFQPNLGAATGKRKGGNPGTITYREPQNKGFKQDYVMQPHVRLGHTKISVSAPDVTGKDMLSEAVTGPINPSGWKRNDNYLKQDVRANPTNRAMNADNVYIGLPHQDLGMGHRKHVIQDWTTTKETTQFSPHGNPHNQITAQTSYDAEYEDDGNGNQEMEFDHYGAPRNAIAGRTSDGGEITDEGIEDPLVEDYFRNPRNERSMPRTRKDIEEASLVDRIDFGDYYHNGKYGTGDDANRNALVRVKDELIANGRYNVGLAHDHIERMDIDVSLRDEEQESGRRGIPRTMPTQVMTNRQPVLIKTKNTEAMNPRFDPSTRISNDMFPFIQGGNATHVR